MEMEERMEDVMERIECTEGEMDADESRRGRG